MKPTKDEIKEKLCDLVQEIGLLIKRKIDENFNYERTGRENIELFIHFMSYLNAPLIYDAVKMSLEDKTQYLECIREISEILLIETTNKCIFLLNSDNENDG